MSRPATKPTDSRPVGERVEKPAAELLEAHRVPHGVDNGARGEAVRRHLPELFDPDGVDLRQSALVQRQSPNQRLGQVATDAIREDRHFGVDVDARLEGPLPLPIPPDAAVARPHAQRATTGVEHLAAREPGENVDALLLGQPGQPSDELVQRDDVVAVILEWGRSERETDLPARGQEVNLVVVDRRLERRPSLFPVRDQVTKRGGVEDGT